MKNIKANTPLVNVSRKTIGQLGESIATKYFIDREFQVLDKNFRRKAGELDIICKKENTLHFIEVKASKVKYLDNSSASFTEERLTPTKLNKLSKMAEIYKISRGLESLEHQIDGFIVIVRYSGDILEGIKVRYMPNIHLT